jgi:RNA polymerase sigma-70 factor (ECF subfamily)
MADVRQESQWILRAQCGDREALERLLSSAQATLTNCVRRLVGPSLTDDVLQDTLIIIAEKLRWLERPDLFRAWTFRIASRLAFRRLKKERRWRSDDSQLEHLAAPDTRPAEDLLHTLLAEDVISPASRAVFVLHFQEGLSLPEVAAVLGIPLGTVKSRLAYGLASARKHLEQNRSK